MLQKKSLKLRICFTKQEDSLIKHLYEIDGIKDWKTISGMIPNRSEKSCRDRYINYLKPNFEIKEWSKEEDEHLLELVGKYGKKWTFLSESLLGRSPAIIKQRFSQLLKKVENASSKKKTSRTARLIFPPKLEEKKDLDEKIKTNFLNYLDQIFENEPNSSFFDGEEYFLFFKQH